MTFYFPIAVFWLYINPLCNKPLWFYRGRRERERVSEWVNEGSNYYYSVLRGEQGFHGNEKACEMEKRRMKICRHQSHCFVWIPPMGPRQQRQWRSKSSFPNIIPSLSVCTTTVLRTSQECFSEKWSTHARTKSTGLKGMEEGEGGWSKVFIICSRGALVTKKNL